MAKKRRSAFVPKIIFGTMFVGVVPAIANCGGDDSTGGGQSGTTIAGVAAGGFQGVGAGGFGAVAAGGFVVGAGGFAGVAAGGFGAVAAAGFGGSGPNRDASSDATDATDARGGAGGQDGGRKDAAIFGVAAGGFAVAQQAFQVPPPVPSQAKR